MNIRLTSFAAYESAVGPAALVMVATTEGQFYARAYGQTIAEAQERADLIAAGPELLKELQVAVAWIEDLKGRGTDDMSAPSKDEILPQLRAALARV